MRALHDRDLIQPGDAGHRRQGTIRVRVSPNDILANCVSSRNSAFGPVDKWNPLALTTVAKQRSLGAYTARSSA